jgi:hypothetical protein
MKTLLLSVMMTALLTMGASSAFAATVYVSQNGGTFKDGGACKGQATIPVGTFDASTPSPGDVIWLCGTLARTVHVGASGVEGNVITLNFDIGAAISLPVCSDPTYGGTCLDLGSNSYITVNGGTACGPGTTCSSNDSGTGVIEATANGTGLANSTGNTTGINTGGSFITIENLIVRNIYQHTSSSDTSCCGGGSAPALFAVGSSNVMHDCTMHDMGTGWRQDGTGNDISFYNNSLYNYNWGFQSGTYGTIIISNYLIHDNHFGSSLNEDDAEDHNHHDDIFIFGDTEDNGATNGLWIYNNLFDGDPGVDITGRIFLSGSHPYNCAIYNNVFVDAVHGVANADIEVTGGTANGTTLEDTACAVYNNTVVGASITNKQNTVAVQLQGLMTFENNAITNAAALLCAQNGSGGGKPATVVRLDYNAYGLGANGTDGSGDNWQGPAGNFNTLAKWQTYAGEAHSTWTPTGGVPGLGLSATGVPLAGSPVIAAGANLSSLCMGNLAALCLDTTAGHTRAPGQRPPTGPWSVGAFEYGSSPPVENGDAGLSGDAGEAADGGVGVPPGEDGGTMPSKNDASAGNPAGNEDTAAPEGSTGCGCRASQGHGMVSAIGSLGFVLVIAARRRGSRDQEKARA